MTVSEQAIEIVQKASVEKNSCEADLIIGEIRENDEFETMILDIAAISLDPMNVTARRDRNNAAIKLAWWIQHKVEAVIEKDLDG
jgi:hypothetical protein